MQLEIEKALVLSNGHLSHADYQFIEASLASMVGKHGMLMHIGAGEGKVPWLAPPIRPLAEIGWKHGCTYILFDWDGPRLEGLPYFDW